MASENFINDKTLATVSGTATTANLHRANDNWSAKSKYPVWSKNLAQITLCRSEHDPMTPSYGRRFWRKMKALTFAFGAKQALALLVIAAVLLAQVHYGVGKSEATKKFLIIAVPYLGLLIVYFLIQAWEAAKMLDKELSAELDSALSRSSEVFAELILAWLNEGAETKARFTLEHVAKQTGLAESSALQGLTLLGNKYGIVRETLLSRAWEYSAVGPAVQLKSRYKVKQN